MKLEEFKARVKEELTDTLGKNLLYKLPLETAREILVEMTREIEKMISKNSVWVSASETDENGNPVERLSVQKATA